MTEKDLIVKIQTLRQIKPRKDWVVFTKQEIFKNEASESESSFISVMIDGIRKETEFIFRHKPAFAILTSILVIMGTFGFAKNSVPGDLFYPVRKITEQTQKPFISEKEYNLKIVNNRLDDLVKIAQNNSTKNLAPAINEYQASVSEVARNLTKKATKNNPAELKNIVQEVKNIEQRTLAIKSLGVEIDENIELDSALVELIALQVQELEKRALTAEQIKSIGDIKTDIEAEKYSEALEKILELNQN